MTETTPLTIERSYRNAENETSLRLIFNRRPSDDEVAALIGAHQQLTSQAVDAGVSLLDQAIEVLSGAMFAYADRQARADALLGELIAWRDVAFDPSREKPRTNLDDVNNLLHDGHKLAGD